MDDQPDKTAIRAIGLCACGGDTFRLKIYSCGMERAHCTGCDQAWSSPFRIPESDPHSNEAMAKARDV